MNIQTTDLTKLSGVYGIRNTKNNKIYIGGTKKSFKRRWSQWRWMLKNNKALSNPKLQNAWNKDTQFFVFEILEVVSEKNLVHSREQWWIDNSKDIYNIAKVAVISRYNKPNKTRLIHEQEYSKVVTMYGQGLSLKQIAEVYKCSTTPIIKILRDNNVELRRQRKTRTPEMIEKVRQANLGKISPKKGRRQSRFCICGNPVGEYYGKDGKFSNYNKTCGDFNCISYLKTEGIKKRENNRHAN